MSKVIRTAPLLGPDPLRRGKRRRNNTVLIAALAAALLVSMVLGVAIGPVWIEPRDVLRVVWSHLTGAGAPGAGSVADVIVWDVRLPRVLMGVAVGAGLAVCGAALQAMVRNMLADPYLLGINSGASAGAAATILFGFGAGLGQHALAGSAFIGALAASLLVFVVARAAGRITSVRLLLAGVAAGYALSALTSFLIFTSGSAEGARSVMFWLLGSLALSQWGTPLAALGAVVAFTTAILVLWARRLDALAIGDETALALGVRPTRFRTQLLVLVSLCTGFIVAAAGSIGFVGLVIPHLARRLVGAAHAWSIPAAALLGSVFLLWADLLSRMLLQPRELPVGIVTAMLGAPFLLWLVRRMRPAA
ncbi:iron ABC transporter permease [Arthrobacter sp. zg-Y820]|uniref:FecCD family ABC transporter permease n=1 Tax=unclassified Arthrobacter TaxID=235627 RepID=UPI00254209EE|nr:MULTISPECIES: iron ABC transporter permease [unclassified Arthrobacter]MCC9197900.1 iron ABC transporter permease [Arthrobacter sp. zg-Y820]MDK1280767.1 iron ABC transporter permease [Arthrobacter sp. zg.Y820]WIB10607.1 iron ABC transporter permease [Arthrobacter sp. zg-Y820]